ncbi:MAG: IS1634 family transposase [Coriobacteriia bacterium]
MSAFIKRYAARNGGTVVQVVFKRGRQVESTTHIGTAHTEDELEILLALARDTIHEGQTALDLFDEGPGGPVLSLERTYSKTLWDALCSVYGHLGFDALDDEVFKQLTIARVIEPVSKLDTIRVLTDLGLGAPSYSGINRTLRRTVREGYRAVLSACCFARATPASLSLVLYDVSTLYFEIQKEDEYRKPGLSKERRLEPQITLGLLVDKNGFPLEVMSFEGNKAETKTIVPVLTSFAERHGLSDITVVADAAMLSGENLTALEELGYHYIVGSRLAKTPYEIAEYLKKDGAELIDNQIFDATVTMTIAGKRRPRRVIYQYRAKRAALDLSNIEKTLAKARKMIEGTAEFKRNRFLKVTGAEKTVNHALVEESRRKAGIKGYVTNLDIPAQEVIAAYHQLFQVEKSFRMAKSDLKARPVFHQKRESIEAHLTVVFAALAIIRHAESVTGVSIRKIINTLEPLRTGVLRVNGKRRIVEPDLPSRAAALLDALRAGRCGS